MTSFDQDFYRIIQAFGYNFLNSGVLEIGAYVDDGFFDNELLLDSSIEYENIGAYFKIGFDSLDSISFPTKGHRINLTVSGLKENIDNAISSTAILDHRETKTLLIAFDWKAAFHLGNNAFAFKTDVVHVDTKDDLQSTQITELGGFLNLSGFHRNALTGSNKVFGALMYQYDLNRSLSHNTNQPLYLGLSAEAGNVWQFTESVNIDELIYSGSIYLGTDTRMGPIALAYGRTDKHDQAVYFYLGRKF